MSEQTPTNRENPMTNKQSVEELEEELLKVMQGHFYPEQDGKELIEAYKQAIRGEIVKQLFKKVKALYSENDPERIKTWRVDQLLISELFGLSSTRSPKVQALIKERTKILGRKKISKKDKERLEVIEDKLGEIPTYESKIEQRSQSAIDTMIEILQEKERK